MPVAHSSNLSHDQITNWFDETISHLEGDKFNMQQGISNPETVRLYKPMITGDIAGMMQDVRTYTNAYYLRNVLIDFVDILLDDVHLPLSLAFSFSDSKVLIWALISTDDESAEDALIIAEAKINANYYDKGFYVSVTIVEKADRIDTPSHYVEIPIKQLAKNRGNLQ